MSSSRLDAAFSPDDLAAIEAAVREVESRSPGEIVPYATDRSDAYPEAAWTTATMGALLGGLAAAVAHGAFGAVLETPVVWLAGPPIAGAALGYLLGAIWPALRIRLVHADVVDHRVRQRAFTAFVEQEVFRTAARTGILLFLSLLERRVIVLADTGINARVPQAARWDAITTGIVAGMRQGRPGPALAEAIRRCGDLLAAHDLGRRGPTTRTSCQTS